jgi:hypothetical protein
MDFDATVVGNEAQLSKFGHEDTYTGSGRADHLRKPRQKAYKMAFAIKTIRLN